MAEVEFDVKQVGVKYVCDMCRKGNMTPAGVMLTCEPPRYLHRCSNTECRYEASYLVTYPTVRTVRVNPEHPHLKNLV